MQHRVRWILLSISTDKEDLRIFFPSSYQICYKFRNSLSWTQGRSVHGISECFHIHWNMECQCEKVGRRIERLVVE
jgi:hypothetical protein